MEKPKLEGMFEKIPFDEAYKQIHEYEKQIHDLKVQGAVRGGNKEIDKKYIILLNKATCYALQFSKKELYALLGETIQDKKEE